MVILHYDVYFRSFTLSSKKQLKKFRGDSKDEDEVGMPR